MKKNVLTKAATFAVTAAMCFSSAYLPAVHAETVVESQQLETISPWYIAIISCSNNLTLGTGGKLNCQGKTEVMDGYKAEVIVELQRKDGTNWSTIKTWSDYDIVGALVTQDWYVVSGTYRLQLSHRAKTNAGATVETVVKYSREVTY